MERVYLVVLVCREPTKTHNFSRIFWMMKACLIAIILSTVFPTKAVLVFFSGALSLPLFLR